MSEYKIPLRSHHNLAHCRDPTPRRGRYGYIVVEHTYENSTWHLTLHRLHATLLVEDISDLADMDIHHRNGCRFDNRLENYDIVEKDWHVVESQKASRLPPYKGLCRDCGHVSYFYDKSNSVYCPGCAEPYDPHVEMVGTQHIDWGTI